MDGDLFVLGGRRLRSGQWLWNFDLGRRVGVLLCLGVGGGGLGDVLGMIFQIDRSLRIQ